MALNSEKLILDRDKLIGSIWEYRWWILDNSWEMRIAIIQEKQYKRPKGKHIEIQAADILKAREEGYSEWRRLRRGYKDIFKWQCFDSKQEIPTKKIIWEGLEEDVWDIDFYRHSFQAENHFEDYLFIQELDYDDLIGLNYALLTYLSKNQPLKKNTDKTLFGSFRIEERLQYHFLKKLKDVSLSSIRLKLKAWVEDDEDELDEEMALYTFYRIHTSRENDFVSRQGNHAHFLGREAKTEADEKKYYGLFEKFECAQEKRTKASKKEAEHYWEHGTSKEHLTAQRFLVVDKDWIFSDEQIEKDTKRLLKVIKARRKK